MCRSYLRGMKQFIPVLTTVLLLGSCGDGKKEAAEQLADSTAVATGIILDLAKHDTPLTVDLGDPNLLGGDSAHVVWNEEFGQLRVNGGDHFAITITEEPGDIPRRKADLERDMLRKHTVLEDAPDRIVYRSQFPDEDLVFIHFYQVIPVGERTFVVEDAAEGRFNEADIKRMASAVRPKPAV